MKNICTIIILLFSVTLSAQTFQYPLSYKAVLLPSGIHKTQKGYVYDYEVGITNPSDQKVK